jgi:predicted ATPase with chaperone activity
MQLSLEHNLLMIASPGARKTLLAHITIDEGLDVTGIYLVADQLLVDTPLIQV